MASSIGHTQEVIVNGERKLLRIIHAELNDLVENDAALWTLEDPPSDPGPVCRVCGVDLSAASDEEWLKLRCAACQAAGKEETDA